jgi:hypothetical protein
LSSNPERGVPVLSASFALHLWNILKVLVSLHKF